MSNIFQDILKRIFYKPSEGIIPNLDRSTLEQIRLKTHSFQMLLSSCAQLWNSLQHLDQTLNANKYFNMIFIRSFSTQVFLQAYSILKYHQDIAPENQEILSVFKHLSTEIQETVGSETPARSSEMTVHLSRIDPTRIDQVGNRMASLALLKSAVSGTRMPTGFVITDTGYQSFLQHNNLEDEIKRLIQSWEISSMADLHGLSSHLQLLIINSSMPEKLEKAIMQGYRHLEMETGYRGIKVVLRPSTGMPDRRFPMECLIRDEFNVGEEFLFRAYKEVVARKYSVPAMIYRMRRGLREEDLPVCVGCLAMINTKVSGSINLGTTRNNAPLPMVIRAVPGMDVSISRGITRPDVWIVSWDQPEILQQSLSEKKIRLTFFLSEEGLNSLPVLREQRCRPSLNKGQVLELAGLASLAREKMNNPGKLRWVLDSHDCFALLESIPAGEISLTGSVDTDQDLAACFDPPPGKPQMISPGIASGKAYFAHRHADLLKFHEKSILVVEEASSRWATLVPWASAVIAEKPGDPLGHLANMAREFEIPALFGVDKATEMYASGQMITVDGVAGNISPYSERSPDQAFDREKAHPLEGTPVFKTMKKVMATIGKLTRVYPLQKGNFRKLSLQDIAHFSHLSATATLVDITMANIDEHHPLQGRPDTWHIWDLKTPELPEIVFTDRLEDISSIPGRSFFKGTKAGGGLEFIPGKEPSLTRRFLSSAFNAYAFFDPIFSRPAHLMFTSRFVHVCLATANLGIMLQAVESPYAPENFIFLLIRQLKSGPLPPDLGLDKVLSRQGFFIRLDKNHFLARRSGDDPKDVRSMLTRIGTFVAGVSRFKSGREQPVKFLEHLSAEIWPGSSS